MWWLLAVAIASAAPPAEQVSRALVPRHDPATCAELADRYDADPLIEALVSVAEQVAHPPWVPMRAAACVAGQAADHDEAFAAVERWMGDPERPGLALVALDRLDDLDADRAESLAERAATRAATSPRFAAYAERRLLDCRHERVRAIGSGVSTAL